MSFYKSAVGAEYLPGYERGAVGSQERDGFGNVLGSAEPAEGRVLGEHIERFLPEHLHHIGVYNAGRNAVYADVSRRELLRQRTCKTDYRVLCRRIRDLARRAVHAPYRRHVHYAARVLMQHARQHLLNRVERAVYVHVEYPVPVFLADVLKKALARNACIVDKQRYIAKAAFHRADHFTNSGSVGNVGPEAHGLKSLGKQRIAQLMNKHDSVGIDCVAMCVNDIICCGAKPIFFLDYIAIGKNEPEKVATLVSGVAEGCVQSGCALIGGETAEHPGTMSADDYDLAGFAVGIVDRAKIIDHDRMRPGDVVIALTSSGIHSNGYSLVRKVFNVEHADLGAYVDELGCTLGEELLRPTKIYVKPVLAAMDVADVHGVSHITGGGFYENIPRSIPDGLCAKIDKSALRTPPIFSMLQRMGSIPEHDMFNTFNMGVGMTMIVAKDDADKALAALKENGQDTYVIGEVVSGEEKVALC